MQENAGAKGGRRRGVLPATIALAAVYVACPGGASAQCKLAELLASDAVLGQNYAFAVGVAGDGSMVFVGAPFDSEVGLAAGAAYVFMRDSSGWIEQIKLVAADTAAGDAFGRAVSVSNDDAMAMVSAPNHEGVGAVYVFELRGGIWTEQFKIVAPDPAPNAFGAGEGLDVSTIGDTAVIGASADQPGGAAYIFVRVPERGGWVFQAKLTASDGELGDELGRSVAISADGNSAVAGAAGNDDFGLKTGSAYVFVREGECWTEQARLLASDAEAVAFFGWSVAISGDGNTVLVGAWDDDEMGLAAGAAYVFVRAGEQWIEQTKLTAADAMPFDKFGWSLALSGDGQRTVIGALTAGINGNGTAYLFVRDGESWSQQSRFAPCDPENSDLYGEVVDLSADGLTTVIGDRWADVDFENQGAAYVYSFDGMTCADIGGDGEVGPWDLAFLLATWGPCGHPFFDPCFGDLNSDCTVGATDLLILLVNWG